MGLNVTPKALEYTPGPNGLTSVAAPEATKRGQGRPQAERLDP